MNLKKFIVPVLAFFSAVNCCAQDTTVVLIPAGNSILQILTPAKQFKYPQFRPGKVMFKDGSIASAQLNYSFLTGEVEFIGPANDTLAISDDKATLIKDILIDSTVFFYNKDYFEQIASHPETGRLAKKQLYVETNTEKIGGYGMASPNSSIQTYGSLGGDKASYRTGLVSNENLFLKLAADYFVENKDDEMLPVNKKNLLKIFPSRKKAINDYLDKNQVNFNREDDLKRLFLAINN